MNDFTASYEDDEYDFVNAIYDKEKDADLKEFSAMSDSKQIAVLDLRMLSKIW